jgi:hypothetical protein
MKEGQEHGQGMFPAHDQASEIAEPGESAFHFPAFAIVPQGASVLGGRTLAAFAVGNDQLDAAPFQTSPKGSLS